MMAPQYERASMLAVAIQHATYELMEPIDRIEVSARHVVVWAGSRSLTMAYRYENSYAPDGSPMPGSGQWVVETVGFSPIASASWLRRLLSSVLRR